MRRSVVTLFQETFGSAPRAAASAPGRVNLIGEHTDYNGGPVLPIAIAERTTVAVGPGAPGVLDVISARYNERLRVRWQEELPKGWAAYVAGVMRELWALEATPTGGGASVAIDSAVPIGAGVSSSAALTVATTKALASLAGATLTARQTAGVAYRAEHDQVGVACGLMDQSIAALAKKDHALLLECASLETEQIPFTGRLLLVDSGTRHDLRESKFNQRRAECEAAVNRLKIELPELIWLSSWPAEWLPRLKRALKEPVRSRAVHVVSETARTRFGAQLLARGRAGLKRFGALLFESHESCRRLYECSSSELDTIVSAAKRGGALGARLTGAGWGGAAIVLVGKNEKNVIEAIQRSFYAAYRREPHITAVQASGGARSERV